MSPRPGDAFGERAGLPHRARFDVMGLRLQVHSNSRELLRLFAAAFGSLPRHVLRVPVPGVELTLLLQPGAARPRREAPPPLQLHAGAGLLAGIVDANNFVSICAAQRRVLLCVDRGMLAFPYHLRYELMEFAVYMLVPRLLDTVPLHGAAVAHRGRAVLLTGPAGSGKSTAVLSCAQDGLELLSEDAVFLEPRSLALTGCANFLHLRTDGLDLVRDPRLRAAMRRSPVIRRRSGARKFEFDIRGSRLRVAKRAPSLAAIVALSTRQARGDRLLEPLTSAEILAWLHREQPFARTQPQWNAFCRAVKRVPAYRLLRGASPGEAASALRGLLKPRRA